MQPLYRRCCGLDVHKKSLTVCVLAPVGKPELGIKERVFRTFTRDLREMRGWLKNCSVTEVVMESTGQYWRPVWNVLEGHIDKLVLMNPQHVKGLAGRKTDRKDARWLAEQLQGGRLRGSFVPPRAIRELRELTRSRVHLLEELNRVKNRIGQLCETGNIKVSSVATDLFGVSGRKMLAGLVSGLHDAPWLADYARGTLRSRGKQLELRRALEGTLTPHQRWLLSSELNHLNWLEAQVMEMEQAIVYHVAPYATQMAALATIPGVDVITAWTLLAELGADMSVFDDAEHVASWCAICPGNRESGGKRMSGRTRKGNCYIKRALCQAAWAASHTKDTYLAATYRRIRAARGHNKAIIALAHQMVIIAYHILRTGEPYQELGGDYYDQRNKPRITRRLVQRLTRMGFKVTLELDPASTAFIADSSASPMPAVAANDPAAREGRRGRGRPCKCAERGLQCHHKNSKLLGGATVPSPSDASVCAPDFS